MSGNSPTSSGKHAQDPKSGSTPSLPQPSTEQTEPVASSSKPEQGHDSGNIQPPQEQTTDVSHEFSEDLSLEEILDRISENPTEDESHIPQLKKTTELMIKKSDPSLGEALHYAVRHQMLKSLKVMLETMKTVDTKAAVDLINDRSDGLFRWPLLHQACAIGQYEIVELLLKHGAEANPKGGERTTSPLHRAVFWGHVSIVELLLHRQANVNAPNGSDETPLHIAVEEEYPKIAELLLKSRAEVDARDDSGEAPLHKAVYMGFTAIADLLLTFGANVLEKDKLGRNPLITATMEIEISSMRSLLSPKRPYTQDPRYQSDNDNKIALDYAIEANSTSAVRLLFEDTLQNPDKEQAKYVSELVLKYAIRTSDDMNSIVEDIVSFLVANRIPIPEDVLPWAAEFQNRHKIVQRILKSDSPTEQSAFSVIERAALRADPALLWKLIAASPRNSTTINQISSALKLVIEKQDSRRKRTKDAPSSDEVSPEAEVELILRNPPTGSRFGSQEPISKPGEKEINFLKQFDTALVAEYYETRDEPVQRAHNVYDVVYGGEGPASILKEAKKLAGKYGKDEHVAENTPAGFTWIHLPATNMRWMKDLALKIMKSGTQQSFTPEMGKEINSLNSFLQSSWFQVPDQSSKTRIMRPQFRERLKSSASEKTQEIDTDEGSEAPLESAKTEISNFTASSAVYMPFLAFSTLAEEVSHKDRNERDTWPELDSEGEERMKTAQQRYDDLFDNYENQIVHGCATLDEAYYHFSPEHEDIEADQDRTIRNRSQVVTKQFLRNSNKKNKNKKEKEEEKNQLAGSDKTYWPILRLNQIWIWTIDDKWLISATTHQTDDLEQSWIEGFSSHLNHRGASGGFQSRPTSTSEMMKIMIEYCVAFYERRRVCKDLMKKTDDNGNIVKTADLSMRQIFSNHINYIGREETELFETFRLGVAGSGTNGKQKGKSKVQDQCIKDVRDELNILRSVVNYQNIVQSQLLKKPLGDSSLSSRYIVNDIADMERLAARIQSAVDSTLSLSGSQIANFQAEEAARQGKSLWLFTVSTIVFLPLSFLTSLFALNNESLQNVPGWVIGTIFGTSFTFTISLLALASWWESITLWWDPIWESITAQWKSIWSLAKGNPEVSGTDAHGNPARGSDHVARGISTKNKMSMKITQTEDGPNSTGASTGVSTKIGTPDPAATSVFRNQSGRRKTRDEERDAGLD